MSQPNEIDPRLELAEIAAAVRAHVEWLRVSGASGLPRGERPETAPSVAVALAAAPVIASPPAASPVTAAPVAATPVAPSAARGVTAEHAAPAAAGRPAPSPERAPPPASVLAPSSTDIAVAAVPAPVAAVPALPPEERKRRLDVLEATVRGCTRCALHTGRTQTVFARGTGSVGLCFVGEGPGADEDAQGFPFVGKAGQLLDRMIEAMGFSRDDVYVCNIVKCRPPENRKPAPEEMAACMPYLAEQLELLSSEVIVALGATAVQGLFGTTEGITRLRGRWKLYKGRVPVMPTFHPAYLLRTPTAKKEVWDDLQAVLRQMGRPLPPKR